MTGVQTCALPICISAIWSAKSSICTLSGCCWTNRRPLLVFPLEDGGLFFSLQWPPSRRSAKAQDHMRAQAVGDDVQSTRPRDRLSGVGAGARPGAGLLGLVWPAAEVRMAGSGTFTGPATGNPLQIPISTQIRNDIS